MIETSTQLRDFVSALLQREGALLEQLAPNTLEVLAPPHLQRALRISDLDRLGFGIENSLRLRICTRDDDDPRLSSTLYVCLKYQGTLNEIYDCSFLSLTVKRNGNCL